MTKMTYRRTAAVLLAALILLSACLCGCQQNEKGFPVPVSTTLKSAFELAGDSSANNQLGDIYDCMSETSNVNELHKKFAVKCLRKDEEGYHIVYTAPKRVLVLHFDNEGKWTDTDKLACIYTLTSSRAAFDKLQIGDSIQLVQAADPGGLYAFLSGDSDQPRCSDHYTEDGYHTHIEYDEDLNIAEKYCDII